MRNLVNRQTGGILAALVALFVFTLYGMGRIPYCECGPGLWTSSAWSTSTSQHFADPYSISHILHGIIFFAALRLIFRRMPMPYVFLIAMGVEIGWEIFENTPLIINRYRAATASLDYFGDSILNSLGDLAFAGLGFWIAARWPWWITLLLVIAAELLMLWWIRDNLTLNILMLIYPLDVIKNWQMAG